VPATFDPAMFQLEGDTHGSAFQLTAVGNDVFLTFTPVPEPGALLLAGAIGAAALGAARRLRRTIPAPRG
jgi:hypothetical protein